MRWLGTLLARRRCTTMVALKAYIGPRTGVRRWRDRGLRVCVGLEVAVEVGTRGVGLTCKPLVGPGP